MPRQHRHGGAGRSGLRSAAAGLTSLLALAATGLVAGPVAAATDDAGPCALPRTGAHHSLGLDSWNGAYPRPDRDLDAVMVFLSFPDSDPVVSPEVITGDYFPSTTRFFQRASYGAFTLRAHPQQKWITMPRPSTWYGIQRDWGSERRSAYLRDAIKAADDQVDFSAYDIVYLVADPDAPGVDSDATKVVNFDRPLRADGTDIKRVVTVFEEHPPDRNVLAHETGHVFDLADLYHRPEDGKGDWDTYVGDWDVMGSQFGLAPDLFGWHKWKLGWLGGDEIVCVQGSADLTLVPMAEAPARGGSKGTRLAVIRTGSDSALAVEARSATGNDRTTCAEGVLIYRIHNATPSGGGPVEVLDTHPDSDACWDRSVYPPLADAPLREGERYTVPGERTRVEVADRTPSGAWTVRITTGT
ncbi:MULTISPECIES: M6 family metalloprotease domain-containing protein [unclassified Streptomyces]|uniref:M6 family metalloprotease domain-containing protein n=1 Tax=unclassified Streptomyces TaxID=2593676 RepID=UPI0001C19E54|nr:MULTISPECIES: M6 family metalloprotease domain-containing protein [unclassified Streptomyces]MYR66952.1 M6 family metalloprotease domain-containing protein [Streptomyces sp. SID4939]MYR99269.1 M6 family metalloprotease domain-containing protein [Streptomyces sp. SID4940]MYT65347.1 M6 family metalloprotease domain-containing protein [Streptomyces sp. SID8357]MYT84402.1 M6 family metalloprotease domain-containing protein [Streptomyces sp. SID8360]MYU37258.1 M6 family metalloprotease domain-co